MVESSLYDSMKLLIASHEKRKKKSDEEKRKHLNHGETEAM